MVRSKLVGAGAVLVIALAVGSALGAHVQTSLVCTGVYDAAWNPLAIDPAEVPVDRPVYLAFTAYARPSALGSYTGLGMFLADVAGLDASLATVVPPTSFPLYDPPGPAAPEAVWSVAFDENNDLVRVMGFIFPQGAAGTYRQNLGAGSAADTAGRGIGLFSFILQSRQVRGTMHLRLASPAGETSFAYLGTDPGTSQPAIVAGPADTVAHDRLVLTFGLRGDIDGDGHVNIFDIFAIAEAWNTQAGDPLYSPAADLDGDGSVNVFDIFVVAENWNR